ncbi:copper resistance protein B [Sphingobium aquiterrae]|uniref:copper resistance protein B n=1 Tax=Sphingobium aquiterrae TaxID=2038656 RepID=UPI003AFABDB8
MLAAPLRAQTVDHGAHQGHDMGTMQMPASPAPSPDPQPSPRAGQQADQQPDPHAGHRMDTSEESNAHKGHAMPGMDGMPMDHDMKAMNGMPMDHAMPGMAHPAPPAPQEPAGPLGTDLGPGNAAPPPIAQDRPADRYFDPAAMADAQAMLLGEHGGMTFYRLLFNLAEYQARKGGDGYRWDADAWIGGDIDRLALKSEGEGGFGGAMDHAEVQALWSRALDPYWNLQAGVRQDFGTGPDRTYATVGVEGLAPYWFDLGAAAFLSTKGDVLGRISGHVDQRITQSIVLQPRVEANFAVQDVPENRIGAGLSSLETGLRLRYEVVREFAPYVGISWERRFGHSADMARAAGDSPETTSLVAGVRFWF